MDPQMETFINCLLASADYSSFYKVMAKQGAQRVLRKQLGRELLKKKPVLNSSGADHKADSKGSGAGHGDGREGKSVSSKSIEMKADAK